MKKEYRNKGALLINLKKNKKIDVNANDVCSRALDEKTYMSLINPYSDLIAIGRDEKGKHIYRDPNEFEVYLACNRLDAEISLRLHAYIGCFEKRLRNDIMHRYCKRIKESGDKQTKEYKWVDELLSGRRFADLLMANEQLTQNGIDLLKASDPQFKRRVEVLQKIKGTALAKNQSKRTMIRHYQDKYGWVPFFVVIHTLSLGELRTLFEMLPRGEKEEFMKGYYRLERRSFTDKEICKFETNIKRINDMRNIVNHYEPFFPFIQNTESKVFSALESIVARLATNYKNSMTTASDFPILEKPDIPGNSYNAGFLDKVERIIAALNR